MDVWHSQPQPNKTTNMMGTQDHHGTCDSFINSVIQGCYICVLLWERISPDAKKALPTLCSDHVLSIFRYHVELSDESRSRYVLVYINPAHDSALRPPGTDAIRVSLMSLPTDSASRSFLSVVLCSYANELLLI